MNRLMGALLLLVGGMRFGLPQMAAVRKTMRDRGEDLHPNTVLTMLATIGAMGIPVTVTEEAEAEKVKQNNAIFSSNAEIAKVRNETADKVAELEAEIADAKRELAGAESEHGATVADAQAVIDDVEDVLDFLG